MLRGILVYTKEDAECNRNFIHWMLEEAAEAEISLQFYYREDLLIGIESNCGFLRDFKGENLPFDFAIIRCIDPLFTEHLEKIGIKTFNSAKLAQLCNDKAETSQLALSLQIPTANTVFLPPTGQAPYPFPFVLKDRNGRSGKQVYLVHTLAQLEELIQHERRYIVQQLEQPGKDLRVFVIGKQIIGSVLRTSKTDFRANYTLGGQIELYTLSAAERSIVEKIIHTLDIGFIGIDFIFNKNGEPLLNELEDVVGSRTLSKLTNINTARLYIEHIKSQF